jgi:predicted NUDIX family NTP pyrophosphohydrolase
MPPTNVSAGLLMYRRIGAQIEVFLAHPGGPYYRNKEDGVWTIPKGLPEPGEALEAAARREFAEETGLPVSGELVPLGEIQQKAGKVVHAWAFAGDLPADYAPKSNLCEIEWPPRSGRRMVIPEIDRAGFFSIADARGKINRAQAAFLDRLLERI